MILTLDLNPGLYSLYEMDDFYKKKENISRKPEVLPGGDGLNVFYLFEDLKEDSTFLTLLGGRVGDRIIEELHEKGLSVEYVKIKDESEEVLDLRDKRGSSIVRTISPKFTREEIEQLYSKYNSLLSLKPFVLIPSTNHQNLSREVIPTLLRLAEDRDVKVGINCNGRLMDIIKQKPYLLIMEKEELVKYSGTELNFESEVVRVTNRLIDRGISVVVIFSNQNAMVNFKNRVYRVNCKVDEGMNFKMDRNLFLAGFSVGIDRGYDVETTVKLAMACSISRDSIGFTGVDMGSVKELMKEITVEVIGGKNEQV